MVDRSLLLDIMRHEFQVIQHLYDRLPPGQLDWRPAEGMRSTLELLRYLTYAARAPIHHLLHDDWKEHARLFREPAAKIAAHEFPARMKQQEAEVEQALAGLSEDDLGTRQGSLPWGEKRPLGDAILLSAARFLTAYRMQLFLYAKASGAAQLSTYNCWMGIDAPAPAPPPAA